MADVGALAKCTNDNMVGVMWCRCLALILQKDDTVFSAVFGKFERLVRSVNTVRACYSKDDLTNL